MMKQRKAFSVGIWPSTNTALIAIRGQSATLEIMCLKQDGRDCFRLTGLAGSGECEAEDGTTITLPEPEE